MATASTTTRPLAAETSPSLRRWAPLSGIAFVVFFIGGVVASSPPSQNASNAKWIADYTGHANQSSHIITGVCLLLAALSLVSFISILWSRISDAQRPVTPNPLPLVAAAMAGACIALGGVVMAAVSGAAVTNSAPVPAADLLRFSNNAGFAMAGIAGMLATALCVASISVQAHQSGVFGRKLTIFSLAVAAVLLASFLFVPIIALLLWLIAASITLLRHPDPAPRTG